MTIFKPEAKNDRHVLLKKNGKFEYHSYDLYPCFNFFCIFYLTVVSFVLAFLYNSRPVRNTHLRTYLLQTNVWCNHVPTKWYTVKRLQHFQRQFLQRIVEAFNINSYDVYFHIVALLFCTTYGINRNIMPHYMSSGNFFYVRTFCC